MRNDVETGFGGIAALAGQVMRHKLLAASVAGIVFVGAAGFITSLQPTYRASGILLLPSAPIDDPRASNGPVTVGQTDPFIVQGELDVLSSPEIARRVVTDLNLAQAPGFGRETSLRQRLTGLMGGSQPATPTPEEEMDRLVSLYQEGISAYNSGRSTSAHVSFTGVDPELAARIVNAHIQTYVDMQSDRRVQSQQRVVSLLEGELATRRADLETARTELGRAQAAGVVPAVLEPLRAAENSAQASVTRTASRLEDARAVLNDGVLQSANYVATDAKQVSAATPPTSRNFPRTSLFLLVAAILSGVAGMAAALAAEWRSARAVRTKDHLASHGIASLGIVPTVGVPLGRPRKGARHVAYWERIRYIRDKVVAAHAGSDGRVVLVTSAMPREGKSMIAASLAQAIAATGRSTLPIDGDLRQPRITQAFCSGQTDVKGFSDLINSADAIDATTIRCDACLSILPAGGEGRRVDDLASVKVATILNELRGRFDFVIMDTPPLEAVSDALTLTTHCDDVILVADGLRTSWTVLDGTIRTLQEYQAKIMGFVVTGVRQGHSDIVSRGDRRRYSEGHDLSVSPRGPDNRGKMAVVTPIRADTKERG